MVGIVGVSGHHNVGHAVGVNVARQNGGIGGDVVFGA